MARRLVFRVGLRCGTTTTRPLSVVGPKGPDGCSIWSSSMLMGSSQGSRTAECLNSYPLLFSPLHMLPFVPGVASGLLHFSSPFSSLPVIHPVTEVLYPRNYATVYTGHTRARIFTLHTGKLNTRTRGFPCMYVHTYIHSSHLLYSLWLHLKISNQALAILDTVFTAPVVVVESYPISYEDKPPRSSSWGQIRKKQC